MVDRENLYRNFGPKMIEAIITLLLSELNILRAKAGLSERTNLQMITALKSKLDSLEDYDYGEEL